MYYGEDPLGTSSILEWSKNSCRVVPASSTLVRALIVLAGDLVRPRSHLSKGCTCWSRYSVVALSNSSCRALMEYRKGGRIRIFIILMVSMEAQGAEILPEVTICSGIIGAPDAVHDSARLRSSMYRTSFFSTWSHSGLTSMVVGSWPCRMSLVNSMTFPSSGAVRVN